MQGIVVRMKTLTQEMAFESQTHRSYKQAIASKWLGKPGRRAVHCIESLQRNEIDNIVNSTDAQTELRDCNKRSQRKGMALKEVDGLKKIINSCHKDVPDFKVAERKHVGYFTAPGQSPNNQLYSWGLYAGSFHEIKSV